MLSATFLPFHFRRTGEDSIHHSKKNRTSSNHDATRNYYSMDHDWLALGWPCMHAMDNPSWFRSN